MCYCCNDYRIGANQLSCQSSLPMNKSEFTNRWQNYSHMGASILSVGQDVAIGTPRVDEIHFLKIVLTSYRIERILGKNIRCRPAGSVAGGGSFWVHKELSKSYREGTAQKLKSMALPYKTKVLKKS